MSDTLSTKLIGLFAITAVLLPRLDADKGSTDSLADRADAVVVAEVQSGQQTGQLVTFVLSISRTIKGDLTHGTTINTSGRVSEPLNRSLQGHYGLWFLRKTGNQWAFLPPPGVMGGGLEVGYLPLSRTTSPAVVNTISPPITINDHIAVELAAALQSQTTPRQLYSLARALLGVGESALVPGLYRALRSSPDPEVRLIGLRGLLLGNENAAALAEIAENINVIRRLHTGSLVVTAICGQRNADPAAVRSLGRIASSSDADIQRCAAMALMYIHTPETLPFLAQLLDSSDAATREEAMKGLSRFVENLPITTPSNTINAQALIPQGPQPYRSLETDKYSLSTRSLGRADQTEYLQFWKSWWASMKEKPTRQPALEPRDP